MAHTTTERRRAAASAGRTTAANPISERLAKLEREMALLSLTEKLDQLYSRIARLETFHTTDER